VSSASASEMSIVHQPISSLVPYPHNARTHSKHQVRQIARSIKTFGFTNPILIDSENRIVAGHGRVEAAKLLGMNEVPSIRLEGLTPEQIRAYVIADNQLAQKSGWDRKILAIELQHLLTIDANLDLTITGFEVPEIDLILQEAAAGADQDSVIEIDDTKPAVTRLGDLWSLGKHRVLCDSALQEASYQALMGRKKAKIVFADPPYNVPIAGHASGNGVVRHRDFAMASGEMSQVEFTSFLTTSLGLLARYSSVGSLHYICMDWRHMKELLSVGDRVYGSLLNLCVWAKDNGAMGSFYRSQHELIFVFPNGKGPHMNNVQLGKYGRNRTNVWHYSGMNTLSRNNEEGNLLSLHPTVKPVALVADAILDSSARGDLVLDNFLGAGSTLIATERVGRICFGIELDPLYVDVAVRRWQKQTGGDAIHVGSGKSFSEVSTERSV
jgi:DNA modification methylase